MKIPSIIARIIVDSAMVSDAQINNANDNKASEQLMPCGSGEHDLQQHMGWLLMQTADGDCCDLDQDIVVTRFRLNRFARPLLRAV